jgi:protein tyrosine/serine phosphatase
MTPPIANFAKVDADLWRGARPDAAGAAWLVSNGVRTDINLEWEQSDDVAFSEFGVKLIRIPDFEPLPLVDPDMADQHVTSFIAWMRVSPKPVFVHCRSGQNRTGVMVAAYRLLVKHDPLDAVLAEFASYHGAWEWADENYLRGLAPRSAQLVSSASAS